MRAMVLGLLGVLLSGLALSSGRVGFAGEEEAPKPPTRRQVADAVLDALRDDDVDALKALAGKDVPDPWLVAEDLCVRGEHDAAKALALAAARPDTETLAAYVDTRRGTRDDAARQALMAAIRAERAKRYADELEATTSVTPDEDSVVSVRLAYARGYASKMLGRWEESSIAYRESAEAAERLGWLVKAGRAWHYAAVSAIQRSEYTMGLRCWERGAAVHAARGDKRAQATVLGNIATTHYRLGSLRKSIELQERSLKLKRELGFRKGVAASLSNLGIAYEDLGEHDRALELQREALALKRELGDRPGEAAVLLNTGTVHLALGAWAKALDYFHQALALSQEFGHIEGVGRAVANIGLVHENVGSYDKALEYQQRSLEIAKARGDRVGVAGSLGNMGNVHARRKDYAAARTCFEKALEVGREVKNPMMVLGALANLGAVHLKLGEYRRAIEIYETALEEAHSHGYRAIEAILLVDLGLALSKLGENERALAIQQRALRVAEEAGSPANEARALSGLTETNYALGNHVQAVANARDAVRRMTGLVGGFGQLEGATARGHWVGLFGDGARAAMALEDPAQVCFFLESGRAGALREALGGQRCAALGAVPQELRRAETVARRAEAAALSRYRTARAANDLKALRARRAELDASRRKVCETVEEIQRTARAAADLVHPRADSMDVIRGRLRDGEALVLYGLLAEDAVALVLTATDARAVDLGKTGELEALAGRVEWTDAGASPDAAIAALRERLIEPLALEEGITRLLLSPDGALCYVPFAALHPEVEIAYVPSGTTFGVLAEQGTPRGRGVLAVGDPVYDARVSGPAHELRRGTRRLVRLPATREEVRSIGSSVLLGEDATETRLREMVEPKDRPRWRAVHLACHGLVDPERPMLSSLALTPDVENDGFVTVLDVLRLRIPTDLAVLSACETAKGTLVRGEGIVGLTRAFMHAGAPRVLCSLWKVDDEATHVLMVKFYELWNPSEDGSKGIGAAAALEKAQEYVRGHEKWKHPYYWAAWVLWGLPV